MYCSDTGWAAGSEKSDFEGWAFPFPGVLLIEDFVTQEEEAELVRLMDCDPWRLSQSGRRKQDYGPKVNIRKQKLKTEGFCSLPSFSREVVRRMGLYPGLGASGPSSSATWTTAPSAARPSTRTWTTRGCGGSGWSASTSCAHRAVHVSGGTREPAPLLRPLSRPRGRGRQRDIAQPPGAVPGGEVAVPLPRRSLLVLGGPRGTSGNTPPTADTSRPAASASLSGSCRPSSAPEGGSKSWARNSCGSPSSSRADPCEPPLWLQT
ncbi:hypothetical protein P7K49_016210 [Saguinus oedipus]|uniref:Uncharacterized protein n=1 Tax=Saguinus oedipus TaxID=9490 RepID=A0ABQ9VBQ4_SAGOE|nr:hypothetical protein P7K49_016210 [Saguinus oedipus]